MKTNEGGWIVVVIVVAIGAVVFSMWGIPQYNVYRQRLAGAARLAEAESSRQILVAEARAKMESAKMLADAEIERAKGVAEANRIIGSSLSDNEAYLRYLWISNMDNQRATIVYIPTEAGMPILEASRMAVKAEAAP